MKFRTPEATSKETIFQLDTQRSSKITHAGDVQLVYEDHRNVWSLETFNS